MDDTPRQAPPADDKHYRLSLEEVSRRFEAAGVPRSMRTLQRYALENRIDCLKTETEFGIQYFVDEPSVERTIKELLQLHELQMRGRQAPPADDAARHDAPRRDMADAPVQEQTDTSAAAADRHPAPTAAVADADGQATQPPPSDAEPRHDAPRREVADADAGQGSAVEERYVTRLESEVEWLRGESLKKDAQLASKDLQIASLNRTLDTMAEQASQTNSLMQGFQRLLGLQPPRTHQAEGQSNG